MYLATGPVGAVCKVPVCIIKRDWTCEIINNMLRIRKKIIQWAPQILPVAPSNSSCGPLGSHGP